MTTTTDATVQHEGVPAFDFRRLSEYGVLWLVNRAVFHPRGFALSLVYADGEPEPYGWTIEGDGTEPWRFDEDLVEDQRFEAVRDLLRQAATFGRAPHEGPEAPSCTLSRAGDPYETPAALRELLRNVVVAADRMRDQWAEGDEGVRQQLWRNLHEAAGAAEEVVYPLDGEPS